MKPEFLIKPVFILERGSVKISKLEINTANG